MRVLVAPDKFKGSLTAREAAAAMAAGWREVFPDARRRIDLLPGGRRRGRLGGSGLRCTRPEDGSNTTVRDPLGRSVRARYALVDAPADSGQPTAFVDCSAASGYLPRRTARTGPATFFDLRHG